MGFEAEGSLIKTPPELETTVEGDKEENREGEKLDISLKECLSRKDSNVGPKPNTSLDEEVEEVEDDEESIAGAKKDGINPTVCTFEVPSQDGDEETETLGHEAYH